MSHTNNLDKDGVRQIFTSSTPAKSIFMSDMDNITDGKFITTDQNDAESKTEGPLKFWRVKSKDVHYGDNSVGKTIRLNLNAGGGLDKKQKHTWKDKPGPKFIWTPQDSKNTEFTYYIRAYNKINGHGTASNHVVCSTKFRGGIHTDNHDPRASCCELTLRIGEGNDTLDYHFEYDHSDYLNDGNGTHKLEANNDTQINKWFGRKTVVWTNADGKSVTARDYIDLDPFHQNGKPKNNWKPLQEKIFTTQGKYNEIILWGGMFTSRIDGFNTVDYAISSLREITPPTS